MKGLNLIEEASDPVASILLEIKTQMYICHNVVTSQVKHGNTGKKNFTFEKYSLQNSITFFFLNKQTFHIEECDASIGSSQLFSWQVPISGNLLLKEKREFLFWGDFP